MSQPVKSCLDCLHRLGDECRHPQAADQWGATAGVRHHLPEDAKRWPKVTKACGFFRPTAAFISACDAAARRLAAAVKRAPAAPAAKPARAEVPA